MRSLVILSLVSSAFFSSNDDSSIDRAFVTLVDYFRRHILSAICACGHDPNCTSEKFHGLKDNSQCNRPYHSHTKANKRNESALYSCPCDDETSYHSKAEDDEARSNNASTQSDPPARHITSTNQ